ncbi:MAG: DNA-binding protein WhiA [Thermanaeromonas sp.]|uniref:DNA-binding protein WhiA n=1 Tax=Thermanaeromonas sp. TaxID=2003697 RepID=UPI00243DAB7C|nr:DNA-binding protein WhiA [Thermanaeromonas sp.]MCG0277456.1 DNA-binding protein WhiA [Thermanaeromonas sp.]
MPFSFSARVKEELIHIQAKGKCCCLAELAALWHFSSPPSLGETLPKASIILATENAALARKAYSLAKEAGLSTKVETVEPKTRRRTRLYCLVSQQDGYEKILKGKERTLYPCCRPAYLRGIFLACGYVASPSTGHHLELVVKSKDLRFLKRLLEELELVPGIHQRGRSVSLYLKDSDQVIRALSLMGAHAAVLEYQNVLVYKEMRNQVNRLVNCETANLSKAVEAGLRQVEAIRFLEAKVGLENLPRALREIAEVRLRYPEATLKELGEMLTPRIGKSGVNHRLRRLEELAKRLTGSEIKDATGQELSGK